MKAATAGIQPGGEWAEIGERVVMLNPFDYKGAGVNSLPDHRIEPSEALSRRLTSPHKGAPATAYSIHDA
ncbi:MAG: hypothetical protein H8K05_17335 [Nitrospira sp.]|nr:hypothetical protein [Nitrospira sp.]